MGRKKQKEGRKTGLWVKEMQPSKLKVRIIRKPIKKARSLRKLEYSSRTRREIREIEEAYREKGMHTIIPFPQFCKELRNQLRRRLPKVSPYDRIKIEERIFERLLYEEILGGKFLQNVETENELR